MGVTTRLATDADLPFLGEADRHASVDALPAFVAQGRVMVAEVDGTAVGFLRWGYLWDEVPFMNLLWVLEGWRGRGVGRAAVEAWESLCRERGQRFVLTSTSSAERAQHFYRRLGYVDSGSLLLPGEPAELLFIKTL